MELDAVGAVGFFIALPPLCSADHLRTLIGIVGIAVAGMEFDVDDVAGALIVMEQAQRVALDAPVLIRGLVHHGYADIQSALVDYRVDDHFHQAGHQLSARVIHRELFLSHTVLFDRELHAPAGQRIL